MKNDIFQDLNDLDWESRIDFCENCYDLENRWIYLFYFLNDENREFFWKKGLESELDFEEIFPFLGKGIIGYIIPKPKFQEILK